MISVENISVEIRQAFIGVYLFLYCFLSAYKYPCSKISSLTRLKLNVFKTSLIVPTGIPAV